MIGDGYFALRSRLQNALTSLLALAREQDPGFAGREALEAVARDIEEPLLFVAAGDAGAGKSSLLDALFGCELFREDPRAGGDRLRVFKYAARETNRDAGPHVSEAGRPAKFLKDFQVVDTPGTNEITTETGGVVAEYFHKADVVLMVFSVADAWASAPWEHLRRIGAGGLAHLVLVVQRADLREKVAVDAVVRHLERAARERLGRDVPVFAVSAHQRLASGLPDAARLVAGSGFSALEAHLAERVIEGAAQMGRVRAACMAAQRSLAELMESATEVDALIADETRKLGEIALALAERREQSLRSIGSAVGALGEACEELHRRAGEVVEKRLSLGAAPGLVFRKAEWRRGLREELEGTLDRRRLPGGSRSRSRPSRRISADCGRRCTESCGSICRRTSRSSRRSCARSAGCASAASSACSRRTRNGNCRRPGVWRRTRGRG